MRLHTIIWGLFWLAGACSQADSPANQVSAPSDADTSRDAGDVSDLRSPDDARRDTARDLARDLQDTFDADARLPDAGDVAQMDAPDMAPAEVCLRNGATLCSDFEALDEWTIEEYLGSVLLSTETAFRGTHALQTDSFTAGGYAAVVADIPPLEPEEQVWMRFWMYFPSSTTLQAGIEFVQLVNDAQQSFVLFVDDGEIDTHAHLSAGSFEFDHFEAFPEDQWVCVEWGLRFSETNGAVELALDGVTIIDEAGLQLQAASDFDQLKIGPFTPQNQFFATTFYFDELFLGDFRPGCE